MTLTKNELLYILIAVHHRDGVFDYENVKIRDWKKMYGMTFKESVKALETLNYKVNVELTKKK